MTPCDLLSAVALDYIRAVMERYDEGSLRFCMVGLSPALVSAIARAALADEELGNVLLTQIPSALAEGDDIPGEILSDESITHWRHCRLPEGKRGVLFAATLSELQRNDKSVEKISRLETDSLREEYESILNQAGLTEGAIGAQPRKELIAALQGARSANVAPTIEMFADYVIEVAESILNRGEPVQRALDSALPKLELPCNSGYFDKIGKANRGDAAEWAKKFEQVDSIVRPYLLKETADGDPLVDRIRKNFDAARDGFEDHEIRIIEAFLEADVFPDRLGDEQRELLELDWVRVGPLFEAGSASQAQSLGERTKQFFGDEYEDVLTEDENELLGSSFPKTPTAEFEAFFERHRDRLSRDRKLYRAWEKYVYKSPPPFNDFLVGLFQTICDLRQASERDDAHRALVRLPDAITKSFWQSKNAAVMRYFAFRYRGLDSLFDGVAVFDFGRLHDYYFPEITDKDIRDSLSTSRDARQLKFEVQLLCDEEIEAKAYFTWEMPSSAIATALPTDLMSLADFDGPHALLPGTEVARQPVSAKGQIQRIDLNEVTTLRDVANGNDGILVDPNSEQGDQTEAFRAALTQQCRDLLSSEGRTAIESAFDVFLSSYTLAIRDWCGERGVASPHFIEQAEAYGSLLAVLRNHAKSDIAREYLWCPALRIGLAVVGGGSAASIIAPWHPLRLAEIWAKAFQAAKTIREVLSSPSENIFRPEIFIAQKRAEFSAVYYPEICIGFDANDEPVLLNATETRYDYTLSEPPLREGGETVVNTLDIDPTAAALAFAEVGQRYLQLLPHESANFSVVLYNAESKDLPRALANVFSSKVEQQSDLQCDLLLTHSDPREMRRVYEEQNIAVADEVGTVLESDAGLNFLSRLRVGFLDPEKASTTSGVRASDLVLLQDVVSRHSRLAWKTVTSNDYPRFAEHVPYYWSRKRPLGRGEQTSASYLTAPVQPLAAQAYMNAVHVYLEGDNAREGNVIPAREISFTDPVVRDLFNKTHRIGEWVVNFDELVDRRLLERNGIHVIRHIHDRDANKRIVVSTTSELRILQALLRKRLNDVDPKLIDDFGEELVSRLIEEANRLSGQVTMRAARYGRYANELLGIVLSMQMLRDGLGDHSLPTGWYCLDDYATWFGQREDRIADIMAIAPRERDGKPVLKIAISEAKFVGHNGYRDQAKKSADQLGSTVQRLSDALGDAGRIDRNIWLHRLGEFMIEGMEPFTDCPFADWDLQEWSTQVRADRVDIELVGLSHVYVHDDDLSSRSGELESLKGFDKGCFQQIFGKVRVAAELRLLAGGKPSPVDERGDGLEGDADPWANPLKLRSGVTEHDSGTEVAADPKPAGLDKRTAAVGREATGDQNPGVQCQNSEEPDVSDRSDNGSSDADDLGVAAHDARTVSVDGAVGWPSEDIAHWIANGAAGEAENAEIQSWLRDAEKTLQRALRGYDMTAEVRGSRLTPNAALIRFRGSDELTVPKVEKRRQELLTSHAIDVINVIAAPKEVIIMVRRPERAILRLRDMWSRRELPDTAPESNTSLLLGAREDDGELLYLNVGDRFAGYEPHGPHTLIAGESGSGKGVLVQHMLLDICATNSPRLARIRMIDPKAGIDFPWLRRMPHLDDELVTDQAAAERVMSELVEEMERRNRILAETGATKLSEYNALVPAPERLPRIWLFHDELADWMLIDEYRAAVSTNASRLGVKARAAGINLVFITQRPDKDALPMQLRANLSNRLVLKVADKRNSELALDEAGAERLLGQGHLAAKLSGESKVILAQVPFADRREIQSLADLIARAWSGGRSDSN